MLGCPTHCRDRASILAAFAPAALPAVLEVCDITVAYALSGPTETFDASEPPRSWHWAHTALLLTQDLFEAVAGMPPSSLPAGAELPPAARLAAVAERSLRCPILDLQLGGMQLLGGLLRGGAAALLLPPAPASQQAARLPRASSSRQQQPQQRPQAWLVRGGATQVASAVISAGKQILKACQQAPPDLDTLSGALWPLLDAAERLASSCNATAGTRAASSVSAAGPASLEPLVLLTAARLAGPVAALIQVHGQQDQQGAEFKQSLVGIAKQLASPHMAPWVAAGTHGAAAPSPDAQAALNAAPAAFMASAPDADSLWGHAADLLTGLHMRFDPLALKLPLPGCDSWACTRLEGETEAAFKTKVGLGQGKGRLLGPASRLALQSWLRGGCSKAAAPPEDGGCCVAQVCMGCRSVRYCDAVCSKAAWPAHKASCKQLAAKGAKGSKS
jgi:hypothetical protein